MRIGRWLGGWFVSTTVNTSGTIFSFFGLIKFFLILIVFFVFMAHYGEPIFGWILDKTTSEENKRISKEAEEYTARVKAIQKAHEDEKKRAQKEFDLTLKSLSPYEREEFLKQVEIEKQKLRDEEYKKYVEAQVRADQKRMEETERYNQEQREERERKAAIRKEILLNNGTYQGQ